MVYMSTVKNKNRLRTIDAVMPHLQKNTGFCGLADKQCIFL